MSFTPRPLNEVVKELPIPFFIGGWVDARTGLDAVAKRKLPALAVNRIPIVQALRFVAVITELPQLFKSTGLSWLCSRSSLFMLKY
jgi:hypothetical protein